MIFARFSALFFFFFFSYLFFFGEGKIDLYSFGVIFLFLDSSLHSELYWLQRCICQLWRHMGLMLQISRTTPIIRADVFIYYVVTYSIFFYNQMLVYFQTVKTSETCFFLCVNLTKLIQLNNNNDSFSCFAVNTYSLERRN